MEFKIGDIVLASRRQQGSLTLSTATWKAKILAITEPVVCRGKRLVTLKYATVLKNYDTVDTIKFITKGTAHEGTTVIMHSIPESQQDSSTDESPTTDISSQESISAAETQEAAATATVPLLEIPDLTGAKIVPAGFGEMKATEILNCAIPDHIVARWSQTDKQVK